MDVCIVGLTSKDAESGDAYGYSTAIKLFTKSVELVGIKNNPDSDIIIHYTPPHYFRPVKGKFNIMFTMWEAENMPKDKVAVIQTADLIIAPTNFSKRVFKNEGISKPIVVCLQAYDDSFYVYRDREYDGTMKFLWLGAPNIRKGFELAVTAYHKAFYKSGLKTELYLKSTLHEGKKGELKEFDTFGAKIDTRNLTKEELRDLYYRHHVLIYPSKGEGAGLIPMEFMSCFPPDTVVTSDTCVRNVWEKLYCGELIIIETDVGMVKATPNHPFLTNRGFVRADELLTSDVLYHKLSSSGGKDETKNLCREVEERRIEDFAECFYWANQGINAAFAESDIFCNHSKNKEGKKSKKNTNIFRQFYSNGKNGINKMRDGLFSRNYRRRRNPNASKTQKYSKSHNKDYQYRYDFDGLVGKEIQRNFKFWNIQKDTFFGKRKGIIYVLFRGIKNSYFVRRFASLSLDEKRALWGFDWFYPKSSESKVWEYLHEERRKILEQDSRIKQKRIIKITKEFYEGVVYNLTTDDGVYFANGFLVHNSGGIVLAPSYSGMKEYMYPWVSFPLQYYMRPIFYGVMTKMAECYENYLVNTLLNVQKMGWDGKLATMASAASGFVSEKFSMRNMGLRIKSILENLHVKKT